VATFSIVFFKAGVGIMPKDERKRCVRAGTYSVVHITGTLGENSSRVGELGFGDVGAVCLDVSAVVGGPGFSVQEANGGQPVPGRLGAL
jgi:hypothetical protein